MKRKSSVLLKIVFITILFIALLAAAALIRGRMLVVRIYSVPGHSTSGGDQTSQGHISSEADQASPEDGQLSGSFDQAASKVKIVALADLHEEMVGENEERIVRKVEEVQPDFIVYLGDMVERTRAVESMDALATLTEQLVKIAPVYYVDGNHEQDVKRNDPELYTRLNGVLVDLGAVQLKDEIVSFPVKSGALVNLCGITRHYYWRDAEQELMRKLRSMDGVNVLACHYPLSFK